MYNSGPTDDTNSYTCGGDLQTEPVICDGLRTVYKHENEDKLQSYGGYNPAACKKNSSGHYRQPPGTLTKGTAPGGAYSDNGSDRIDNAVMG